MVTAADGIYQMNLDLFLIAVISHTLGFPYTINMSATSHSLSVAIFFVPYKVLAASKYGGFYYEMIISYVIRISRHPHMDEQRSYDSIIFWLALW